MKIRAFQQELQWKASIFQSTQLSFNTHHGKMVIAVLWMWLIDILQGLSFPLSVWIYLSWNEIIHTEHDPLASRSLDWRTFWPRRNGVNSQTRNVMSESLMDLTEQVDFLFLKKQSKNNIIKDWHKRNSQLAYSVVNIVCLVLFTPISDHPSVVSNKRFFSLISVRSTIYLLCLTTPRIIRFYP